MPPSSSPSSLPTPPYPYIAEMDRLATLLSSLTMDGDQLEVLEAVRPAIGSLSRCGG